MTASRFSICVMGSSHSAAVATAWRQRAFDVQDNVSVIFFAGNALSLKDLGLKGRSLVPSRSEVRNSMIYTSGGKDRIDIDDYDAFVTVALGLSIELHEIVSEFGTAEHLSWGPVPQLLSQACFEATLRATFENSLYLRLADMIRSVTTAPILNIPKPFPPETVLDEPPLREKAWPRDPAFLEKQLALPKRAAEEASAAHGAEVLWPPSEATALPGFTKRQFGEGALTLRPVARSRNNPREDGRHMNEDYGELVMKAILARLDEISGGRVIRRARHS